MIGYSDGYVDALDLRNGLSKPKLIFRSRVPLRKLETYARVVMFVLRLVRRESELRMNLAPSPEWDCCITPLRTAWFYVR